MQQATGPVICLQKYDNMIKVIVNQIYVILRDGLPVARMLIFDR